MFMRETMTGESRYTYRKTIAKSAVISDLYYIIIMYNL